MNIYFFLIIIFTIFSFVLLTLNFFSYRKRVVLDEKNKNLKDINIQNKGKIEELELKLENCNKNILSLSQSLSKSNNEIENLQKYKDISTQLKEDMYKEFELVSNKILENRNNSLMNLNKKELDKVVDPFKGKINDLEAKITSFYDLELRDKISLREEVKKLYDLNTKLGKDAENLTNALKGNNKIQGNWGEMILENVLSKSGLRRDEEYSLQEVSENSNGNKIQPDVIIYLPENRHVIIDAKVSLRSYDSFVNATNDNDKKMALDDHVKSLKNHIFSLSQKSYSTSIKHELLDFVLMFIPVESSYYLLMKNDAKIFWDAWDKKVLIVSPSTLHSTLKIISALWKQERQTKNAKEIARLSGALYDKFVLFLEDMQKMGNSIKNSESLYLNAMQKLTYGKGNLIGRVEKMRLLGAKNSKNLPENLIVDDIN